jgi:Cu+-exporting ATPase
MKTILRIEGMTCGHCVSTVEQIIRKAGISDPIVLLTEGRAYLPLCDEALLGSIVLSLTNSGYPAFYENPQKNSPAIASSDRNDDKKNKPSKQKSDYFRGMSLSLVICLALTIPQIIGHFIHSLWGVHFKVILHPLFQLVCATYILALGIYHLGEKARKLLRQLSVSMESAVLLGATLAYLFSLYSLFFLGETSYLYFETTSSIITFVLLGAYLEQRAITRTQYLVSSTLTELPETVLIEREDKTTELVAVNTVQLGEIMVISEGEVVPCDGIISWGTSLVDESIVTGESKPVLRQTGDTILAGSRISSGSLKSTISAGGDTTFIASVYDLVRSAQTKKPKLQRVGDSVASYFMPLVLFIALVTFVGIYLAGFGFESALIRTISILVIACPCAVGLAAPTAIMVAVGAAVRDGIIFKGGDTIEKLANAHDVLFDKTGTLTTGCFSSVVVSTNGSISEDSLLCMVAGAEKFSKHPIARSLVKVVSVPNDSWIKSIVEEKGLGLVINGVDGDIYRIGSYQLVNAVRPESREVISELKHLGINPYMVTGDSAERANKIAKEIGIDNVFASFRPEEKLTFVKERQQKGGVIFVGDGINDSPALAAADIGVSFGEANRLAIDTATVILLPNHLSLLPKAIELCRRTVRTIKQNYFWAIGYNIVAIPLAIAGVLSPTVAALIMAFSDVLVVGNSLRLWRSESVSKTNLA